jgi:hypothetical protein
MGSTLRNLTAAGIATRLRDTAIRFLLVLRRGASQTFGQPSPQSVGTILRVAVFTMYASAILLS